VQQLSLPKLTERTTLTVPCLLWCCLSALCRWQEGYEGCYLQELPHRQLTAPGKVMDLEFDFDLPSGHSAMAASTPLQLQAHSKGRLNAVAFWFELELDSCGVRLSNRPAMVLPAAAGVAAVAEPLVSCGAADMGGSAAGSTGSSAGRAAVAHVPTYTTTTSSSGDSRADSVAARSQAAAAASTLGWGAAGSSSCKQLQGSAATALASPATQQDSQASAPAAQQQHHQQQQHRHHHHQHHHWGQALQYLDVCCDVQQGCVAHLQARRGPEGLRFVLERCDMLHEAPAAAGEEQQEEQVQQSQQRVQPLAGQPAEEAQWEAGSGGADGEVQQDAGQGSGEKGGQEDGRSGSGPGTVDGSSSSTSSAALLPVPRSPWKVCGVLLRVRVDSATYCQTIQRVGHVWCRCIQWQECCMVLWC
jgi:hypothetical protein